MNQFHQTKAPNKGPCTALMRSSHFPDVHEHRPFLKNRRHRRRKMQYPQTMIWYFSPILMFSCFATWATTAFPISSPWQRRSLAAFSAFFSHKYRPLPLSKSLSSILIPNPQRFHCGILFASKNIDENDDSNAASSSDTDDWKAMLAAFEMYKAAYGNLKIPLRFVVPALPPWPEKAWGLKLGQRVAAIRSTGKYVHNEERRRTLDEMGFVWRLRAATSGKDKDVKDLTFDQIYSALVTYKEHIQKENGPLNIPPSFVVPDCEPWPENTRGLPLGRKLASIRSKSFLSAHPGAKEQLEAIDFQLDGKVAANDARFQLVYDALQRYREIYGDLLVPQPFVVPEKSKQWPEHTWGLRLGARVNAIRSQGTFINSHPERRTLLDDLGFVWSPPKSEGGNRRGRRRREEIEAMEARKSLVEEPERDTGSVERSDAAASESLDSLFRNNFDFDQDALPILGADGGTEAPTWGLEGGSRIEEDARRAEEEARAAEEYKPPKNLAESLAEAKARAIEVGVIEDRTDVKHNTKGKREKNIPWFNDDFGGEFVFDDVVEALSVYKSIYGDFSNLTDESFVISSRSDDFSDDTEDVFSTMDAASRAAAAIAKFEDEEDLFSDDGIEAESFPRSTRSVAISAEPSAGDWPEHLDGMALGNIVKRIRDGSLEVKHLPERKAKLDELGFDWGDPKYFLDVPFEKAVCAMYAYYLVRGDMFVYEDFVMPDEDPWPQALAGYEIGKAVRRIRELQNFLEAYHPEKVSLLRMLDFVWFPTLALPLDPNEPEMTPEMMMLSAMGHPDYAKMIDIPMGLPEKIMTDGPFLETDDPKLWWRKWHSWDYVKDYWYDQGRRDNAFVLRGMGYPQMAAEHEAKYGPGLFQQINETFRVLENGLEDKDEDEVMVLLEKLKFFREEMTDCNDIHPIDRDRLLADLDNYIFSINTGNKVDSSGEEDLDDVLSDYEYEEVDEEMVEADQNGEADQNSEADDFEEKIDEEDSDDFDVDEELGFDT